MNLANFHAWWTVALLAVFVGIVVWAFGPRRRHAFEEAARIPLDDDDAPAREEESRNG